MTEPYLVAMEHAEFHAQAVLRKHIKNRPLGQIEDHYRYIPPQPVLSCRTVDVDISGTRTYRAKSAAEIIEEQQRLIHHVYKQARNAASAPARKSQFHNQHTAPGNTLKSLSIDGNQPLSPRKPRPTTGIKKPTMIVLKPRPNTALGTSSRRYTQAGTVPHLFHNDLEWHETASAYQNAQKQLKEQWSSEKHSLDEGQFIRGKRDNQLTNPDPRTSNQWLLFGAGQDSTTAGIVDAFTVMKNQGEVYSIDGTTGSQVARKLCKGDKIRVGINGSIHSHSTKIKQWATEQEKKFKEAEEKHKGRSGCPVPLCWNDQLKQESVKVVSPCRTTDKNKLKSLFETHPVIVNDTPNNNQNPPIQKKSVKINEGYKVKVRSKFQSATGPDSGQRVTASITIDKRSDEFDREIENLTYEDILQMKVQLGQSKKTIENSEVKKQSRKNSVQEQPKNETVPENKLTEARPTSAGKLSQVTSEAPDVSTRVNRPSTSPSYSAVQNCPEVQDLVVESVPAGTTTNRSVRSSGSTQNAELASTSRSAQAASSARPDSRNLARVSSAGRPPPVKSNQRRSTPNSVASGNKDPEYIQIAQRLPVSRLQGEHVVEFTSTPDIPGVSLKNAIDSVTSCNRPVYSPGGSVSETENKPVTDDTVPVVANNDENLSPLITPPPSPYPVPEYAFDIPTAGALESEANSVVTPGDLEKELNQSEVS